MRDLTQALMLIIIVALSFTVVSSSIVNKEESENNKHIELNERCDSLELMIKENRELIILNVKIDIQQDTSLHMIREILEIQRKIYKSNK